MSRSFKHQGWIQDQSGKKFGKRFANKRVRRTNEVPNYKEYKKFYQSWNIADYKIDCRGVLESVERRPGRKFKRIRIDRSKKSPWWWLDLDDKDTIWRDWRK